MKIVSWNVNGIRAGVRKGFLDWLVEESPDVLCLQETKARKDDLNSAIIQPDGYTSAWHSAEKRGYSGVAVYYKQRKEPVSIDTMGIGPIDAEGRVQVIEFDTFTLINAYYPNSQPERTRLDYKLSFCEEMLALCERLRKAGTNVIVCGDYNIAHKPIDLARPAANENNPGYYPEERAAMDTFVGAGYVDTFRHFVKDPDHYSWWSYRARARERNVGWRLDYHCVNEEFLPRVREAKIHPTVMGSDHCPVSITLKRGT